MTKHGHKVKNSTSVTKNKNSTLNMEPDNDLCGFCTSVVPEHSGMLCDGDCNRWYHLSCVGLTDDDYLCINDMAEKVKWYCKNCEEKVNNFFAFYSFSDLRLDIGFLKDSIEKLTQAVKDVADDNSRLKDTLLESVVKKGSSTSKPITTPTAVLKNSGQRTVDETVYPSWSTVSRGRGRGYRGRGFAAGSCATQPAKFVHSNPFDVLNTIDNKSITESIPDFDSDEDLDITESTSNQRYNKKNYNSKTSVRKTNRPRPRVLIGSKDVNSKLKSVKKVSWVFVSRLDPTVKKTDVSDYLMDAGVRPSDCIELPTKYDSYKSFKVGIQEDLIKTVLFSDFWPEGTLVKEFVSPSRLFSRRPAVFLDRKNP